MAAVVVVTVVMVVVVVVVVITIIGMVVDTGCSSCGDAPVLIMIYRTNVYSPFALRVQALRMQPKRLLRPASLPPLIPLTQSTRGS